MFDIRLYEYYQTFTVPTSFQKHKRVVL